MSVFVRHLSACSEECWVVAAVGEIMFGGSDEHPAHWTLPSEPKPAGGWVGWEGRRSAPDAGLVRMCVVLAERCH